MSLLRQIADHRRKDSPAAALRRRRMERFLRELRRLPPPVRLLDVGGTVEFWEAAELAAAGVAEVTVLNSEPPRPAPGPFRNVTGDARAMAAFTDKAFDVAFSNSVIEHVGTKEDQRRMASEIRRVATRYFVQTPNRFFPIEPHFLFPFFQFLPVPCRVWIASRWRPGWYCRPGDPIAARREVQAIRLLNRRELQSLFPEATISNERFCGLVKSLTASFMPA